VRNRVSSAQRVREALIKRRDLVKETFNHLLIYTRNPPVFIAVISYENICVRDS
jgi:hypothetical protein